MPLINLHDRDRSRGLYRITRCEHFLSMIQQEQNVLVHPREWDDPFENVILNSRGRLGTGELVDFAFRDGVFAQCWSLHRETDLMWRGYSPDKNRVKLRTTVGALHDSLYEASDQFRDITVFLGKVEYLTRDEFRKAVQGAHILDGTGRGIAATLLIKRNGFWPEGEVRLIYSYSGTAKVPKRHVYAFKPNTVITDAVLDPRMSETEAEAWKAKFAAAGFTHRVIQSGLYKRPPRFIIDI